MNELAGEEALHRHEKFHPCWSWVVLAAVILVVGAIRIRLLDVPLERDEGEYAYGGQLILQGVPPYAGLYNMKLPGIYVAYALILAFFGQTRGGIHLALLFINGATILVLFRLARRWLSPWAALAAGTAFALLSLGQWVQGVFANAEHFVLLPALGGLLLLTRCADRPKPRSLLLGGLFLGISVLMKQHGFFFLVFGGLYLFLLELRRRPFVGRTLLSRCALFLLGALLPYGLACLILWACGVFGPFWSWTFSYARDYVSYVPFSQGLELLGARMSDIVGAALLIWLLSAVGTTGLLWKRRPDLRGGFALGFLVFSFLAVCPGWWFRPHYFIYCLPAAALLAGAGFHLLHAFFLKSRSMGLARILACLLYLAVFLHALYQQRDFFFFMSPVQASRATYGRNPFPESLEIARYIRENSTEESRIAIIGSEPQIFFYSKRRSATGHIYIHPLLFEPTHNTLPMQREMIREIESARPEYLLFINIQLRWLIQPHSETLVVDWAEDYKERHYRKVGMIEVISDRNTVYRWGEEGAAYKPLTQNWIAVYRRKDG